MIFLPFSLHLLRLHSMQMTLPFGPPSHCATFNLQAALNRLVEWSSKWRLPLNPLKCETSFFSLEPYQSRIQPSLYILNTPPKFNPHPTFLGVTFDRTLSNIMSYPYEKIFTADSVLSALLPLPPGAHQWNPCVPYIKILFAPSLPMLPQVVFFSSPTHIISVERMHRSSCRVITGYLSSTSIPLFRIEALLPPLGVNLTPVLL